MNELRLFLKFEYTPSSEEQYFLEKEIRSFLFEIYPNLNFKVKSAKGSWLILMWNIVVQPLGVWLLDEFASWATQKGFDNISKKFIKDSENSRERLDCQIDVPFNEDTSKNNNLENLSNEHNNIDIKTLIIAQQFSALNTFREQLNANKIVFSEWSDSESRGRLIDITKGEEGLACRIHQTDSKDDFDSYSSFNIK